MINVTKAQMASGKRFLDAFSAAAGMFSAEIEHVCTGGQLATKRLVNLAADVRLACTEAR
jgi:hypothetical protein